MERSVDDDHRGDDRGSGPVDDQADRPATRCVGYELTPVRPDVLESAATRPATSNQTDPPTAAAATMADTRVTPLQPLSATTKSAAMVSHRGNDGSDRTNVVARRRRCRSAARIVLRLIPVRRASSLIETPRTKCSRRSSAQPSTPNNPLHPHSVSTTKPGSTAIRTPPPPARRGSTFDRRRGVSFHPAPTSVPRHPLKHSRRVAQSVARARPLSRRRARRRRPARPARSWRRG